MKPSLLAISLTAVLAAPLFLIAADPVKPIIETLKEAPTQPAEAVTKTDEEWRKLLTPEQ